METRTYTAIFNVGDKVRIEQPDYEHINGKPHPLAGLMGSITKVIFPGDVLYGMFGGIPNGTGEVKYCVTLNTPKHNATSYLLSEKELLKIK